MTVRAHTTNMRFDMLSIVRKTAMALHEEH
jgi:hypothetical protein